MTRQEFIECVNDFWDLKEFCDENNLRVCDDVYDEDSYNYFIDENLAEWARNDHWWELLDRLRDLPSGLDWYYCGDYDWEEADFEEFKQEALEEMDRFDAWDEEDEDENDEDFDEYQSDDSDDEVEVSFEAFSCVLKEAV